MILLLSKYDYGTFPEASSCLSMKGQNLNFIPYVRLVGFLLECKSNLVSR